MNPYELKEKELHKQIYDDYIREKKKRTKN